MRRGTSTQRGYGSDWRRCRNAFIAVHPTCKFCQERGVMRPAQEVDHIISIAERPDLRLDWSNLRALCKPCHSTRTALDQAFGRGLQGSAHPAWLKPAVIPVTIVCGPPAAGKSHYVREHACADDLVLDLDVIASQRSGGTLHGWDRKAWLGPALHARNALLGTLCSDRVGWKRAWLIVSEASAERREWWADTLRPTEIVVLETPASVCFERLRTDAERDTTLARALVTKWWGSYRRREGDRIVLPS